MPETREPRILGQPVLGARDFIQRMHSSGPHSASSALKILSARS